MRYSRIGAIVALAVMALAGPTTLAQQPGDVAVLLSGDEAQRLRGLELLRRSPDLMKDPAVTASLREHLQGAAVRARQKHAARSAAGDAPQAAKKSGEGEAEADARLVSIAAKGGSPELLPELAWFVGTSATTMKYLVTLGDKAFPTLVRLYDDPYHAQQDCTALLRNGVLTAVARMVKTGTLGKTNHGTAEQLAARALQEQSDWSVVNGGIELAGVLRAPALLTRLGTIADGTDPLSSMSSSSRELLRKQAKAVIENPNAAAGVHRP